MTYSFDRITKRTGTYCTQWDYIEDRFGEADLLPFSISDTDFQTPQEVSKALSRRLEHGIFGYTRWNHQEFKEAVQKWYRERFSAEPQQDWIVYSPSVIYTIAKLIHVLTDDEDHVVIQTPAYDAFFKMITDNNRRISANPLVVKDGKYHIDFADLENRLAHNKAKVLLLCSPHNPTGRVWTENELEQIINLCRKYHVFIISDEIHMDIVLQPNKHTPIISKATALENVCICTSASKTFNIPGLIGSYAIIPSEHIRDEFLLTLKNRDGLSSTSILGLTATIEAYQSCGSWVDQLNDYIKNNMLFIQAYLEKQQLGATLQIPEATYLAWINIENMPYTPKQVQHALIHEGKVAIMAGDTYGAEGRSFLRLNAGCPQSKLADGLARFTQAINFLKKS
ncbi:MULTISPECIES: MalY/PatB family protein [Bacillaceae]|uniref:MalY/PatB family protein n=1 Tax=Bacillaceae TaxID=186817 RepID=UPI001E5B79EA|nr:MULTISPECIES: MalY/PatB family protein [Bacillaceae]MCE4049787.1 pyridoxal phosphate-dependent aminotransferase [Bacillus sp. Au-Bac7]MCM3032289.1 pyridoxal phosphate-dependent aminotransferase [Niallia sp. MER 6]MDL0435358.1 MalY/PatB family protein [Niallia sp. SS-2023]UPO87551.1 pyridoxal phosphate-dependent aminotransferase [Niallia sp. Man26]